MSVPPMEQIQHDVDSLYAAIQAARSNIEQGLDGPVEMRLSLGQIERQAEAIDTELCALRGMVVELMVLASDLHRQRNQALHDRDRAYQQGYYAARVDQQA